MVLLSGLYFEREKKEAIVVELDVRPSLPQSQYEKGPGEFVGLHKQALGGLKHHKVVAPPI